MSSEALKEDIRKTAREKAEKVLTDAKTQAETILAEAETQAKKITDRRVQDSERLMAQIERSEAAKARMECAKSVLSAQSRYVEEAFRQAETRVNEFPSSEPDLYRSVLTRFITEAIAQLGSTHLVAVVRYSDRGLVEDVLRKIKAERMGSALTLDCSISAESLNARGGILLHTDDMRAYYVNTFESRFLKARDELRGKVVDTMLGRG